MQKQSLRGQAHQKTDYPCHSKIKKDSKVIARRQLRRRLNRSTLSE